MLAHEKAGSQARAGHSEKSILNLDPALQPCFALPKRSYNRPVDAPQFGCDLMLGGLARWLRFAGFDTLYDRTWPSMTMLARARADGRWFVTRNRVLVARAGPRALWLRTSTTELQVAELRQRLVLSPPSLAPLSRCSRCNGSVLEISRELVRDRVPPFVAMHAECFYRCATCQHIYWPGTHCDRISRRVEHLFGITPAKPP